MVKFSVYLNRYVVVMSMRDNLLFFGFPESKHDNVTSLVFPRFFYFYENELVLADVRETVKIDRAYRIGHPRPNKTLHIVAKLNYN